MLWFWLVIVSQFANAGAQLLDKVLLTKSFPRPAVLTFWTAVANLLGVVFVFWDFILFPGWYLLIVAILSGVAFTVALQFLYMGLKRGEASHIAPLVGAMVPVVSFIISYYWLAERLTFNQGVAVGLLVAGSLLISFETSRKNSGIHIGMLYAVIAGSLFALSYVMSRVVYLESTFSTGFAWARLGSFLAALPLLFNKQVRNLIFAKTEKQKNKNHKAYLLLSVNKGLAALYFLGMNYAMSLASATIVNALAGLQYAVLFVLVYFFSKKIPKFFNEYFTKQEIFQQVLAIVIIVVGLVFIVL